MAIVVAQLRGGLGNQLFQYAAVRAIARQAGAQAAIDISLYAGGGPRHFALAPYDLGLPVLSGSVIAGDSRSVTIPAQAGLERLGSNGGLKLPLHREDNYEFEPATKALRNSAYLVGFWQSPKYFSDIADDVRRRFGPAIDLNSNAAPAGISGDRSVSVHVRRGDYLLDRGLDAPGLCERGYYDAAIGKIRAQVPGAHFFIFSDDSDWCHQHFTDPDMTVLSTPAVGAGHDLALMASCRHHILANSSLGWWGGWLGDRDRSIVIAPIPWFNQAPPAADLIPGHWIRLNRRSGADWSRERVVIGKEKVSAIILSTGRAELLSRALQSVRKQDHGEIEIVVGLSNPTLAAVAAVKQCLNDYAGSRLAPSAGAGAALEAAIALAEGAWIAFLDERDLWLPEKLRIQLETAYLTGAEVVCCRTMPVAGPQGVPTIFPPPGPCEYPLQQALLAGERVCGISHTIARSEIFRKHRLFDGGFTPDEGSDAWMRLLLKQRAAILWGRYVASPIPFVRR
ncbi:MAG: alpha-1,2-fucosyltransferase [Xanthobacteraceae bacterium]|jgi:hypothetical protein